MAALASIPLRGECTALSGATACFPDGFAVIVAVIGKAYENVYVGQSLHVCSRVRNHLTGHGNGDVYADVRNGKPVFVKIVPCPAQQMNALEKKLIKAFNATSSYNNTAGGSRRR